MRRILLLLAGITVLHAAPAHATIGYAVGDTAVALLALDQDGTPRSLADFSGKWTFVDICAAWCAPCMFMASEAQEVQDAFDDDPSALPFQYVDALFQAPSGDPSTIADAQIWAARFDLTSVPVLHEDGSSTGPLLQWFAAAGFNAMPSGVLLDDHGVIRARTVGYRSPQEIHQLIGDLSGTESPEPPPPPVLGHLSNADMTILSTDGATEGPMTQLVNDSQLQFFELQPMPGLEHPVATVNTTPLGGGLEQLDVNVFDLDLLSGESSDISLTPLWSARMSAMSWSDGFARRRAGTAPVLLSLIYISDGQFEGFETGVAVPDTLNGTSLRFGFVDLAPIPGRPANLVGYSFRGLTVSIDTTAQVVAVPLAGSEGTEAMVARPWPNPARTGTTLAWTLARGGDTRLDLFDVSGRLVRRLVAGERAAGPQSAHWDLRNDRGRRVPSGVYLSRLIAPGGKVGTTRIVVVE